MTRTFFRCLEVLLLAVACSPKHTQDLRERTVTLSCVQPAFLKPGDRIALLSPSYHTPMENVEAAAAVLRGWGFEPVIGAHVGAVYLGKYAGKPKERVSDLEWALRDPSIKAILCNRGGYGTIRLVDMLPQEELSAHPKWLVGYSDITTLLEMETRAGVMGIHGTMGTHLAQTRGNDPSSTLLRDLLMGKVPAYKVPAHPENRPGRATGILVGGNLCTFTPILGTQADATLGRDIILFIEEDMSHIDRLINTLILNGVFERCKGIVLGEFTGCKANLGFDSVEDMICSYVPEGIPVLCGFPTGHDDVNLPLVMGAPVTMDVTAAGATLTFGMEGRQVPVRTEETVASPLQGGREIAEGRKQRKLVRLFNFLRHFEGIRR
ncbi:MAG: LD-carboxypeptidase [Bacteroidales bacterium]|nr:LD-carboxypeptidase [Bacteroidales bacterium]